MSHFNRLSHLKSQRWQARFLKKKFIKEVQLAKVKLEFFL